MALKDNIQSNVGVIGSKLSGGQIQRIAIARALISKPDILILDEATCSLDHLSELEVKKSIEKIKTEMNITIVVVAHRLSSIQNADKVFTITSDYDIEEVSVNQQTLAEDNYKESGQIYEERDEEREEHLSEKREQERRQMSDMHEMFSHSGKEGFGSIPDDPYYYISDQLISEHSIIMDEFIVPDNESPEIGWFKITKFMLRYTTQRIKIFICLV
jgi:ABC-type methionine transport system ATPase subunit